MPFLLNLFIQWVALLALWLIFVFQITVSELLVGAGASVLTVFALRAALRAVPLCFQPRLHWLMQTWRLPRMIFVDLWILLKELFRVLFRKPNLPSLELVKLDIHGTDSRTSAVRALLIILISTSPNSVVLDIDRETREMLIHKLHRQPVPVLVSKLQS